MNWHFCAIHTMEPKPFWIIWQIVFWIVDYLIVKISDFFFSISAVFLSNKFEFLSAILKGFLDIDGKFIILVVKWTVLGVSVLAGTNVLNPQLKGQYEFDFTNSMVLIKLVY